MSAVIIRFPNRLTADYFERMEDEASRGLASTLVAAGLWAALYGLFARD